MVWIIGTNSGHEPFGPLVQSMLRDVGIDLRLEEQTVANTFDSFAKGLHNVGATQWWFPDPLVLANLFHTNFIQSFNRAHLSNPTVDKLIDDALTVPDAKRAELYKQVQDIVAEDADAIPLVDQVTLVGLKKEVKGYKFNAVTPPLLYDAHR